MCEVLGFIRFESQTHDEVYWQHTIPHTTIAIRVMSGLSASGEILTREHMGIRIYLMDLITNSQIEKPMRVRRTRDSLRNIRERVGILWRKVQAKATR